MSFQIRYNPSRAKDILANSDAVVFSAATALRTTAMKCEEETTTTTTTTTTTSSDSENRNNKKKPVGKRAAKNQNQEHEEDNKKSVVVKTSSVSSSAFLGVTDEKFVDPTSLLERKPKENENNLQQLQQQQEAEEQTYELEDHPLVLEALSRGCRLRRKRNFVAPSENDGKKSKSIKITNNDNSNEYDSVATNAIMSNLFSSENGKAVSNMNCVLMTPVELQRLEAAVGSRHVAASRTDTQSLFEKVQERLSQQRAEFVNALIENAKKDKVKARLS